MNLYPKVTNAFSKIKEKIQGKLLFEDIRKTQRQCKITMAGLERNLRKSSKEKQKTENGIISDKNAIAEEYNTFLPIQVQIWLIKYHK